MIRITQSFLIQLAMKFYEANGWTTVYYDLPGGRRSGVGERARMNSTWEQLYNLSPDIVFQNGKEVRLFEVDSSFNDRYAKKLLVYRANENELKERLSPILGTVERVSYGFVSSRNQSSITVPVELLPFRYLYYSSGKLYERLES